MSKLFLLWLLLITPSGSTSLRKVTTLFEFHLLYKWISQALRLICLILKQKQTFSKIPLLSRLKESLMNQWQYNNQWCTFTEISSNQSCWQLVWSRCTRARLSTQKRKLITNHSTPSHYQQTTLEQSEYTATNPRLYLKATKQLARFTNFCQAQ